MDPVGYVHARGGVASGQEILAQGVGRRRLTQLVANGQLSRPRNGWYSTLAPQHPRFRAARIGGRLTGASALADMGAWMLDPPRRLEVSVERGSARLRADPDALIRWDAAKLHPSELIVSLEEALIRVVLDHELDVAVPCIDWALHTGRLDRFAFEHLILALPHRARVVRKWVDGASESVLESVARVRLVRSGWHVRSQVPVGELGSIDLVVGDEVGLELDGREHHEKSFERDRRKDLQIVLEGRVPLRVTYSMLRGDWSRIERALHRLMPAQNSATPPAEPRGRRRANRAREWGD